MHMLPVRSCQAQCRHAAAGPAVLKHKSRGTSRRPQLCSSSIRFSSSRQQYHIVKHSAGVCRSWDGSGSPATNPSGGHSSSSSSNDDSSSGASSSGGSAPDAPPAFQPRLLTAGLRRADSIERLEHIWSQYQQHFNSFHFSALMQQLARLHDQVTTGIKQVPSNQQQGYPQAQQQQQQQRDAELAELEQELGHLLDDSGGNPPAAASNNPAAGGANSSNSRRRRKASRGLADLCPALDGYEHLNTLPASPSHQQQEQQQRQVSWRSTQQPQTAPAAAGTNAASTGIVPPSSSSTGAADKLQYQRPQWRPPPAGPAVSNTNSSSSHRRRQQQQQHQQQQQQQQPGHMHQPHQRAQSEQLGSIHRLALAAAAAALQPGRQEPLDNRAYVMTTLNLAKMQLHNEPILQQLLQTLNAGVLHTLDPQQLTNLIWSLGACVNSARADKSPYTVLAVPAILRGTGSFGAEAAVADVSSSSSSSDGAEAAWEQVPAVVEPQATVGSFEEPQTAAMALDSFADAVSLTPPLFGGTSSSSRSLFQPSAEWLAVSAECLLAQLPQCSSQGVAMSLWGFAQLGYSPEGPWWDSFWACTQDSLQQYSAQDLALLMCAVGKLGPEVSPTWLSCFCSAACDALPSMSSQQLTMCLWGLACAGAAPHKAFVLLWFLSSMQHMQQATTQELSMWLYALTLLRLTPSPSWCAAFVEASFTHFTAPNTRPQDLVTAMWSISRLGWSPPLLYWRGLMEAALNQFDRFGPQDLANCISAACAIDITCVTYAWLTAFLKASQVRLSAFEPVQLAHTANALALIHKAQPKTYRVVDAAWQAAFVKTAAHHLAAGRFSQRNLVLVVTSLRVLQFKPSRDVQQFLAQSQKVLAAMWAQQQQLQQQEQQEQPSP